VRIFTAGWFTPLPASIQRIGISRGVPRAGKAGRGYRIMRELAPGLWFLSASPTEYVVRYYDEILAALDPRALLKRMEALGQGRDVALLCFERPPFCAETYNLCHRRIAASWLEQHLGIGVPEYLPEGIEVGDTVPIGAHRHDWLEIMERAQPRPSRALFRVRKLANLGSEVGDTMPIGALPKTGSRSWSAPGRRPRARF
jgi:hypothetical protein